MMQLILILIGAMAILSGCGDTPLPERVVLLGLDAADPLVIEVLRERGELPHFDRLIGEGVSCRLRVKEPIFSPIIWTSILTGFKPENHGINSFTLASGQEGGVRIPVTSNMRRRRAVWDIIGSGDRTVGVVGHWVTWPAEPVNGFLLSNYTWPPSTEYEKEWAPSADWDTVGLRSWPDGVEQGVLDAVDEERFLGERHFKGAGMLDPALTHYLRKDLRYLNAGLALFDRENPDFFTLYMEGIDFFQHRLWLMHSYYENQRFGASLNGLPEPESPLPARFLGRIGPMVADSYRLADRLIGLILDRLDLEKDVLIVVSDHGFRSYPEGTKLHVGDDKYEELPFWHSDTGVLYAAGPPFKRGKRGVIIRPEDVTLIVLAAFGISRGADMDGEAPEAIFSRPFLRAHPIESISTYETGARGDEAPIESPYDESIREMLRSLGYLD